MSTLARLLSSGILFKYFGKKKIDNNETAHRTTTTPTAPTTYPYPLPRRLTRRQLDQPLLYNLTHPL